MIPVPRLVTRSREFERNRRGARAAAARACLRVYGEAVTHPAGEGEGERVLFPRQETTSGGGDRYIDSRNAPAVSGNCVASRSLPRTPPPHPFLRFPSSSLSLLPLIESIFRADSEAIPFRSFKFASEKRSTTLDKSVLPLFFSFYVSRNIESYCEYR